jgi:hypothetical protein
MLDATKIFAITDNYLAGMLRDVINLESYLALFISSLQIEGTAIVPNPTALQTLSLRTEIARHLADRRKKAESQRAQLPQSLKQQATIDCSCQRASAPSCRERGYTLVFFNYTFDPILWCTY